MSAFDGLLMWQSKEVSDMKKVFRYIRKRRVFFESVVLVWMLMVHDGDHRHRMSKTTVRRPLISHHKKNPQKHIVLFFEEE
jgi:hypothetical protein